MTGTWTDSPRLRWLAAALVVINGFFPALWILLTSLKTQTELVSKPITWWPQNPTLENYVRAFADQPLLVYLGNSFVVALLATVVSLRRWCWWCRSRAAPKRHATACWPLTPD